MSITADRSRLAFQKTERALLKLSSGQGAEIVHGFRTSSRRLEVLLEQLLPQRERNQKKLRKLLTKEMIREIRKRLKRGAKEVRPETSRDALSLARSMLNEVVRPAGPVSEDLLHRYRGMVKRARYAAEFAPKSAEATQFIAQLKRLQDAVGNWHDWRTLTQAAAKRLGDVNQSSLVAALHNVTGGKFRHAVSALSASPTMQNPAKPVPISPQPSHKVRTQSPTPVELIESAA